MSLQTESHIVELCEMLLPWLLVLVPIVALAWPSKSGRRFKRAAFAFCAVVALGAVVEVEKIFLNAHYAHERALERRS
jgi:hypothetical protein